MTDVAAPIAAIAPGGLRAPRAGNVPRGRAGAARRRSGRRCRRCCSHNLQLDLVEDLALGREWQLGYWKHPPLPWWAGRPRLSCDRRRARGLPPRAALGRRLHVCGVAARPRHRRRLPGADRGAGAGRHPLLQFLGAEVRPRPDAAAVLGDDGAVSLSGARARPREALDARRRLARAVLLVEVCGLRARGQHRPVHAVRSRGAARACARPGHG